MIRMKHFVFLAFISVSGSAAISGDEPKHGWHFTDIKGRLHKPFDDPSTRGIVFVFVSTDCPIANSYQPLLRRLDEQHESNGIRFFQVHPHSRTTIEDARKHASEFGINSTILLDPEQSLAKRVGATITPEVVVYLEGDDSPIYQGRIDNLYAGYGKKRKVATSNDLADVLDDVADGNPLKRSKTDSIGCFITFEKDKAEKADSAAKKTDKRIGYEILEVKSVDEIIAWASKDITPEQFEALELPLGWFKNQPREIETDRARFLNSPGREEGSFVESEQFGHLWLHVATVKQLGKRLDSDGHLFASRVVKDQVAMFDEGSTMTLLVSPQGEVFPRITRDVNRTDEEPWLPQNWLLIEYQVDRPVEFRLPEVTTVIRTDNQDSFQGPVAFRLKDSPRQLIVPNRITKK